MLHVPHGRRRFPVEILTNAEVCRLLDACGCRPYAAHSNLGNALGAAGREDEAIRHHRVALGAFPDNPEVLNNLAWLLATGRGRTPEKAREAVRLAEKAAASTGHQDATILDTLAAAYAAADRFDRAIAVAEYAVTVAQAGGDAGLAEEIGQHLALYRAGTAYRR